VPNNIRFLPMTYDLASLLDVTRKVKLEEDSVLHVDRELFMILLSKVQDGLDMVKSSNDPAGLWLSTMMNVVPFRMESKIPMAEAQELVQCHWRAGQRFIPTIPGFVERWDMRYNNNAWRCICNEDGMLLQSPRNPLVSHLRNSMTPEDMHKFGAGPIFGDVLIVNKKTGW